MIIDAILEFVLELFNQLRVFLHLSIISELPWGIDSVLVSAVGGYKALAVFFPPLTVILTAFILYLSFRVILMVLKMIPFIGRSIG